MSDVTECLWYTEIPEGVISEVEVGEFKFRIVGFGIKRADQFKPHNLNWRKHPQRQRFAVHGSLASLGWVDVCLENRRSGNLIDGHERVWQGLKNNEYIPFIHVDLNDAEEAQALLSLDAIAALAETDRDSVAALLEQVQTDNADVMEFLAGLAKDSGLDWGQPEEVDAEPQMDRAAELQKQWGTSLGQLWKLGDHRLLIGDCTVRENVERLMGGERAKLAPVDPPYNVGFEYDGETVDDKKTEKAYEDFSRAWFGVCQSFSEKQIVTAGCNNLPQWLRWFDSYHVGTWIKSNSMTNGRVSRFWCWEPVIFFGDKFGKKRTNDIFDYPIGQQKDVANHPCPKPLKMWGDLIENYSEVGDLIYEAFGGSGTTIIAAQNLGRRCYAMEISPAYCAVILQRFLDATGIQPELLDPK